MNMEKLFSKGPESFLKELQKEALWGEVYIEKKETLKIIYEPNRIDEIQSGEEMGLSVRAIKKDLSTEFCATNSIPQSFFKKLPLPFTSQSSFLKEWLSERLEFLKKVEAEIPKSGHIKHYRLLLLETKKEILIITPEKEPIKQKREYVRVAAIVVSEKDGVLERGYEAAGYVLPFSQVKQREEFLCIGKRAAELALKMLSAQRAPAGVMPVVLSGEAGGT
jgi:TldD protein